MERNKYEEKWSNFSNIVIFAFSNRQRSDRRSASTRHIHDWLTSTCDRTLSWCRLCVFFVRLYLLLSILLLLAHDKRHNTFRAERRSKNWALHECAPSAIDWFMSEVILPILWKFQTFFTSFNKWIQSMARRQRFSPNTTSTVCWDRLPRWTCCACLALAISFFHRFRLTFGCSSGWAKRDLVYQQCTHKVICSARTKEFEKRFLNLVVFSKASVVGSVTNIAIKFKKNVFFSCNYKRARAPNSRYYIIMIETNSENVVRGRASFMWDDM